MHINDTEAGSLRPDQDTEEQVLGALAAHIPVIDLDQRKRRRSQRVVILLLATIAFGLGDLYSTITHMQHLGFVESNPFAAHLVAAKSVPGLILFKLGSLGIAAGLLYHTRVHISGELGAWVLLFVMLALTVHWANYNDVMAATMQNVDYQSLSHSTDAMAAAKP